MVKKVVNATQLDADLLSIADAIREKGGTSAALLFPDEFITAINDIHGGGDAYAAISVTYPAGSVCTCTQAGQDTLTAGDISGAWLFVVPVGGEWTITANRHDGATAVKTVSVFEQYSAHSVVLSFAIYLFENGNQHTEITGANGWTSAGYSHSALTGAGRITDGQLILNAQRYLGTDAMIARADHKEIVVNVTAKTGSTTVLTLANSKTNFTAASAAIANLTLNLGENRFPLLSTYPESFYVVVYSYTSSAMNIDKIWLE